MTIRRQRGEENGKVGAANGASAFGKPSGILPDVQIKWCTYSHKKCEYVLDYHCIICARFHQGLFHKPISPLTNKITKYKIPLFKFIW